MNGRIGRADPLPVSLLLLGGGQGNRMGGNKLFLEVPEGPLLPRLLDRVAPLFGESLLSVAPEDRERIRRVFGPLTEEGRLRLVWDRERGRGPLEGLARGLAAARFDWVFLLGCDMPFVREAVVRALWAAGRGGADAIVARLGEYLEPLHAFYRGSCRDPVEAALLRGDRRLKSFYGDVDVSVVDERVLRVLPGYRTSFANLNAPEDLERLVGVSGPEG
jgi:molybdopterin-guanine dinucleotide biosynthesis protein A